MPHAIDTFKLKEHLKLEMEYGTTVPEKPSKHLKLEMEYGTPVPENHLNIFYSEIFDIMVLRWLFHIMIFTCDSHCTDLAASQIAKLGNVYMRQKTPRSNRMLFPIWNLKGSTYSGGGRLRGNSKREPNQMSLPMWVLFLPCKKWWMKCMFFPNMKNVTLAN